MTDDTQQLGLHNLRAPRGATKAPKRKGRGNGSGLGKTAGRGHNGQNSRSGGGVRPGFEGGQMPLIRRIPKRGFFNPAKVEYQVVNLKALDKFAGEEVNPTTLAAACLIGSEKKPVKVLGTGDAARAFVVTGCKVSATASEKIAKAGGRIEE
jgi:large subunit ribosomal protein L15